MMRRRHDPRGEVDEIATRLADFVGDSRLLDRAKVRLQLVVFRCATRPESVDGRDLLDLLDAVERCAATNSFDDRQITEAVLRVLGCESSRPRMVLT